MVLLQVCMDLDFSHGQWLWMFMYKSSGHDFASSTWTQGRYICMYACICACASIDHLSIFHMDHDLRYTREALEWLLYACAYKNWNYNIARMEVSRCIALENKRWPKKLAPPSDLDQTVMQFSDQINFFSTNRCKCFMIEGTPQESEICQQNCEDHGLFLFFSFLNFLFQWEHHWQNNQLFISWW